MLNQIFYGFLGPEIYVKLEPLEILILILHSVYLFLCSISHLHRFRNKKHDIIILFYSTCSFLSLLAMTLLMVSFLKFKIDELIMLTSFTYILSLGNLVFYFLEYRSGQSDFGRKSIYFFCTIIATSLIVNSMLLGKYFDLLISELISILMGSLYFKTHNVFLKLQSQWKGLSI